MEVCKIQYTSHIDVRYAETDQMGVVHHSVYAVWFDRLERNSLKRSDRPMRMWKNRVFFALSWN